MGTRGYIVFVRKGKWYAMYQHYDAYDMWHNLSKEIIELLEKYSLEDILKMFDAVVWHDGSVPATDEEVEKLKEYADLGVSSKDPHEWYVLLRRNQGSLTATLTCSHGLAEVGEGEVPYLGYPRCFVDLDKQLVGDKQFGTYIPSPMTGE